MLKYEMATVKDGAIVLDEALPFPNDTQITVTVEKLQEPAREERLQAWREHVKWMEKNPMNFHGFRMTRDELHERR